MTAIPCGQKKSRTEMIQSQTVTPPLAAMEGATFRLKTATTNSSTRSQRPRTRLRLGGLGSVDISLYAKNGRRRLCLAPHSAVPCEKQIPRFTLRCRFGMTLLFEPHG